MNLQDKIQGNKSSELEGQVPAQDQKSDLKMIQNKLEKQYEENLDNGTTLKIGISLEMSNFNEKDIQEILSSFAADSHNFYLYAAREINNKLL